MDYLYQAEDKDGARFTFNLWPSSRIEYKKLIAPLACMYSPMKKTTNLFQMHYNPISCNKCGAVLNPYCQMEQACKFWGCPFCLQRNAFPQSYQGISEQNLPAELLPECTTIEYCQVPNTPTPPIFMFVVDTAMTHPQELKALKEALLRAVDVLPKDCLVGFITFGSTVRVYDLSYPWMTRCVCFDGERDYTPAEVQKFLNMEGVKPTAEYPVIPYILPLKDVEVQFASILEELQQDPQSYNPREQRAARATGTAVSVALSLLQHTYPSRGARIMVMSGGPITIGPGLIVNRDIKEDIRSHHHLRQETAKHVSSSIKYFDALAERAVAQGHAVDIFSCCLDEIGIYEMKSLVRKTGGIIVNGESFGHAPFRDSLFKLFNSRLDNGLLDMAFDATLNVIMSPELKVAGAIGHLHGLNNKTTHVAESAIGIGGTSSWKMCTMSSASSYGIYFDIVNAHNNPIPDNKYGMIQFRTNYVLPSGTRVTRVTTVAHPWSPPSRGLQALVPLFDQEATLALIARMVAFRTEQEETDPRGWIDKHLIQVCNSFGRFTRDRPDTFQLPPELAMYPEFIFHFRRGTLCQVFGNSPDETTYFRHYMLRENVSNILTMVQPSLDAYSLNQEEPVPVLLSSKSVKPDIMLLLDTFFHVVVFSGETIAKWRNARYHEQESYENLKLLLEAPVKDAEDIIAGRFPVPLYIMSDSGGSQARFLYAVLDPAETHKSTAQPGVGQGGRLGVGVQGEIMYTEDVPLSVFLSHLYKKAVSFEG